MSTPEPDRRGKDGLEKAVNEEEEGGEMTSGTTDTVDNAKYGTVDGSSGLTSDDGPVEKGHRGVHDDSGGESVPEPEPSGLMSRLASRITSRSSIDPGPPPDGGWAAWMVALSSHLVVMNTWGVINSFGTFQSYYTTTLSRPPEDISWIGSIQVFLLFFIGAFTGRLTDAGFFRPLYISGSLFICAGAFATSWCTQYWHFFLAQGVCVGLGNGLLFCPCLAVLATWFLKRRALAIGVGAAGSATGGMVFPSMVRELLPRVGFGWTIRAIGFIQLGTLAIGLVFLKTRIQPRRAGKLVELGAFKELDYTFYAAGSFMCFMGVYFTFYYLAAYSRDIQGMSYPTSLNLLLILNGVGAIGRLVPNHFADTVGTINMFIPMAGIASLLMYAWIAVSSAAGLYVWSVFYGLAAGAIQSLFPAGLSALTTDPRKQGTRIGMVFTLVSFAVLIGPPIAGAVISSMGGDYAGAQAFAATSLVIGMGFLIAAREVRRQRVGWGWRCKV